MKIALQLYSIKDVLQECFEEGIRITAKAGYNAVELAGYYNYSATDMKALLSKHGLSAISSHVGIERFINNFEEELEYAIGAGYNMMVCPWLDCNSLEEILEAAEILESCAQKAKAKRVIVGYHNHAQEFKKFDDKYAMDILMEKAPSVKFQPDLYWIAYAGLDPIEYIRPYAEEGRLCSIHAKEIAKEGNENVYVGEGRIDFTAAAKLANPEVVPYIVEQEEYTTDYLDGISKSYIGLSKIFKK